MAAEKKYQPQRSVALWLFPESEFAEWKKICHADGPLENYQAYQRQIETLASEALAQDLAVVFRESTVAQMQKQLAARFLENTTANRARVLAEGDFTYTLGLKITANAIGSAILQHGNRAVREDETAVDVSNAEELRAVVGDLIRDFKAETEAQD